MATQTIETVLALKDQMTAGLSRVGASLSGFGRMAGAAVGKIGSGVSAVSDALSRFGFTAPLQLASIGAGVYKAVDALRELTKEGIELNRTFENTSIRIAGTLKAFDVAPTFAKAQAQAAGVMGTVADLAAKLPGETEDYISVFATALPKAIAAGMTDMQEVAKFTSYWTAVATSNMVDAQQAGMDLFRVLSGQAGADVRMFTVLAEKIGMTAEAFNKLAAAERLAKIKEAIGAFDAQLIAAGDTFDAKAGEFESRMKEIKRLGSELAFDNAKKNLEDMNATLQANKQELIALNQVLTSNTQTTFSNFERAMLDIKVMLGRLAQTFEDPFARYERLKSERDKMRADSMKPLQEAAAAQEADLATRRARIAEFEASKFGEIEKLLPTAMQKGLGATGFATPQIRSELIKLGKTRKDDVVFLSRIADYIEFMRLGEADLAYAVMSGRGLDVSKADKAADKREREKKTKFAKPEAPVTNFYNSRFDIKQNFAEGFDPDRVAVAFAADLGRAGEMKTQSGYNPPFTGR